MLTVKNLNKNYPSFKLSNISFDVPKGYIVGFIGRNGAGKTTTLKSVLNIVKPDTGNVEFFGKDINSHEVSIKQDIAYMLGAFEFYPRSKVKTMVDVYKSFYKNWDNALFDSYLSKFSIDSNKRITELSAGMRVKFGIALALSHDAKLLILDEPTSGLDPIAREELLDIFQEVVSDGEHSILFSTHITSDLDKCADYILLIKDGQIKLNATKDDIIENHILVKGNLDDLKQLKSSLIGYKTNKFGFSALAQKQSIKKSASLVLEKPNLEDIMIYYNKEANENEHA